MKREKHKKYRPAQNDHKPVLIIIFSTGVWFLSLANEKKAPSRGSTLK
jgi:hypothetical protein